MTERELQIQMFLEHKKVVFKNMRDLTHKTREDLPFWDKPSFKAFYNKKHRQELLDEGKAVLMKCRNYHDISNTYKKFSDKIYDEYDQVFIEIAVGYAVDAKFDEQQARQFYQSKVTSDFSARELFEDTQTKWVYNLILPDGLVAKIDMRKDAKQNLSKLEAKKHEKK